MSDNSQYEPERWGTPKLEPIGICHECEHRYASPIPAECRAFPTGIPVEILIGQVSHTEPYPGDNGIQFKQKGAPTIDVLPS